MPHLQRSLPREEAFLLDKRHILKFRIICVEKHWFQQVNIYENSPEEAWESFYHFMIPYLDDPDANAFLNFSF